MNETEICRAAVERYGRIHQITKAVEELGGLSQALARWLNGQPDWANIFEEIADVEIMIEQLKIMLDDMRERNQMEKGYMEYVKAEKLGRLAGMLSEQCIEIREV